MKALRVIPALAESPAALPILIVLGILIRLAWLIAASPLNEVAEASNVANALASGRGFADPYFVGSGPTAHLMPVSPAIAGFITWLFGMGTGLTAMALALWAAAQFAAICLLLDRLFAHLRVPRLHRNVGLALFCLVPVFLRVEAYYIAYWETGLATILALLCLCRVVAPAPLGSGGFTSVAGSSLLCGFALFTGPTVAVALGPAFLLKLALDRSFANAAKFGIGVLIAVLLFFVPWTMRNQSVFGVPIVLRDNLGLELSIANSDNYFDRANPAKAYYDNLHRIHPLNPGPGMQAVKAMGEYAYLEQLKRRAFDWIGHNPAKFARLCLWHYGGFYFPADWQVGASFAAVRAKLIWAVAALGVIGLAFLAWRRTIAWAMLLLFVLGLGACYVPFVPVSRYFYPVYGLLVMVSAHVFLSLLKPERQFGQFMNRTLAPAPGHARYSLI